MIHKREAVVDLAIVGGCCLLYVLAGQFDLPIIPVIFVVLVTLAGFVAFIRRRRNERWRDFGFRLDNFKSASFLVGGPTILGLLAIILIAWWRGQPLWSPNLVLLTPIYPLWGIAQQFIFQGIVHRRFQTLFGETWRSILLTSCAFAVVHVPDPWITFLTWLAGLFWSWSFRRSPNLWVLGVSHGLWAAAAYMLLLNADPVVDFF